MTEDQIAQTKTLFQQVYSVLYKDGKFDVMADQAEADGDIVPAVSQLTVALMNSVIKDAQVQDLGVLFALAITTIADMLEALEQTGMMSKEGDFEAILNNVVAGVLQKNPDIAQQIADDPALQQMMQEVGGPEGVKPALEEEAAGGNERAAGVLEGAEEAQAPRQGGMQ